MADEGEQKLLKADVMETLLEEKFAQDSKEFQQFVDSYAVGRDDKELGNYILRLYEFSMSHPWPEEWLKSCLTPYEAGSVEEMLESSWASELIGMIRKTLQDVKKMAEKALEICYEAGGPWMYGEALESDAGSGSPAISGVIIMRSSAGHFLEEENMPSFPEKKMKLCWMKNGSW